jgi:hypothetical protein
VSVDVEPARPGRIASRLRHVRRSSLRPFWHAIRPVAILLSVATVFVLGTIGAEAEYPSYTLFDSFFAALSLFTLGGSFEPPLPASLQIARALAPILTGYAVIQALIVLFRDNVQLVRIGLFARRHVVMAGLGSTGSRLVRALYDTDDRIVAVELDRANPAIATCRDRGISALIGDARDEFVLRRTGLLRAHHLFVACGDDRVDMDVAAAASELVKRHCRRRPEDTLTIIVALDDLRLWRGLSARILTAARRPGIRLELFHVHEAAARILVERHSPFAGGDPAPHVLLVGVDGVGEALVLRIARRFLAQRTQSDQKLPVTILSPAAEAECAWLLARYPAMARVCNLRSCTNSLQDGDIDAGVAAASAMSGPPQSIYVCLSDESEAISTGLALAKLPALNAVSPIVTLQDSDSGMANALEETGRPIDQVTVFGVLSEALTGGLMLGGLTELLARAKHEEYLRSEELKGTTPTQNAAMRPWTELPTSMQSENRAFVDGIPMKLQRARFTVIPSPLADPGNGCVSFSPHVIEKLAEDEHDRWSQSRIAHGYRYGPVRKDEGPDKRHPLLVAWEDLPADEKEKDRSPVRQLPAMLARAGFEVVPLGHAVAPQAEPGGL